MSSTTPKLTKKQKKALAFRERRTKGKSRATADEEDDNDVPVMEDQTLAEIEVEDSRVEGQKSGAGADASGVREGKAVENKDKGKKRKREEQDEAGNGSAKNTKKRKNEEGEGDVAVEDEEKAGEDEKDQKSVKGKKNASERQQRFILFVGNLKYTTSKEAIQKHFEACDPPPQVRLITPKPSAPGKPVAKSKGCAFLEFTSKPGLQSALKLHQSTLEGRSINVELTAGGGGKSDTRMAKLKERNKELHQQRKKKIEKKKGVQDTDAEVRDLERPQRYSATSGVDQAPATKRTWSIPDEKDAENKAAAKTKKRGRKPPKSQGTGVNAIPVG